ncbi:MAG: helix-turn-helix transcriptional regulator [Methylococcales bacterium]
MFQKPAYSIPEAREIAGISRTFLYKRISDRTGPRFRRSGSKTLILHSDLVEWLESLADNSPLREVEGRE